MMWKRCKPSYPDHLEPIFKDSFLFSAAFERSLWRELLRGVVDGPSFFYCAMPSFQPSYSLILKPSEGAFQAESRKLVHDDIEKAFRKMPEEMTASARNIASNLGTVATSVLKNAVDQRKKAKREWIGLDGVEYRFGYHDGAGIPVGRIHSPLAGSQTATMVELFDKLWHGVENGLGNEAKLVEEFEQLARMWM